ncbi:MAG TPA: ATP-binding protein [Candidatus Limnocylindrales bacterium]|nr:ATP-binding protein [Candidatus Limnocylindrales bacterium]
MTVCYLRGVSSLLTRDRAAITVAAIATLAGLFGVLFGHYDTGLTLQADEQGRIVVWEVAHLSQAERDGVRPGMLVAQLNGSTLISLPQYQYAEPDPDNPEDPPRLIGTVPPQPVVQDYPGGEWQAERTAIEQVSLISPEALATGGPDRWQVGEYFYRGSFDFAQTEKAFLPGLLILFIGVWFLRSPRAARTLRDLAIPLSIAVATPFLVAPLTAIGSAAALVIGGLLAVAGMIPLALGYADLDERPDQRRSVRWLVVGLAAAAGVVVIGSAVGEEREEVRTLTWVLTGAIPLVPGLIAAGPIDLDRLRSGSGRGAGRLMQSTELAIAGTTPLMATATVGLGVFSPPFLWPLGLWLIAVALAGRFTVRPLARLATRATLQRDLVVAATEAERARLAADIHDDALQELTLLVRRLEASGDSEGAEIGRTVADRLRAICGDLRLPILDDLGVGPALDWLVLRIERLAGGEVRLERADDARHSPDVELAIFRVAQEALANAVKHGRPPIVVRYRSTPAGISLAIDDAGPGIDDDAPETAEKAGRFGLLNMAQRAEQIGAILDVKRWPSGGTHVALEWRPR